MNRLSRPFALGVLVLVALALPSSAFAGRNIFVTVANRTPVPLKLIETRKHCWYPHHLSPANAPTIPAEATRELKSEVRSSGRCAFENSHMDWDVLFERSNGTFK